MSDDSVQVYAKHLSKGNRLLLPMGNTATVLDDPKCGNTYVTFRTESGPTRLFLHDILEVVAIVGNGGMKKAALFRDENDEFGDTGKEPVSAPNMHEDLAYIRLDAFNLWPGAVIAEQDNWDVGSLQVVTEVHRNADTEQVVIFYRDLDYAGMAVSQAPGVAPRTSVVLVDYNSTFRVFGNVIAPEELGDNNHGQSRNPDGDLYVTK